MWSNPFPLCPEYTYKAHVFPCTSVPNSGCNNKILPPLESTCTLTNYDNAWRMANLNTLYPAAVQAIPGIFPDDSSCTFDPLDRMLNSKFEFDLNGTSTLDPRYSPIGEQLLTFAGTIGNQTLIDGMCGMNMNQWPFMDGDLTAFVDPWYRGSFTYAQILGPICTSCTDVSGGEVASGS